MLSLAIKTLLADRGKLTIALLGVIFSLLLVNLQGGLFIGMVRKTSILVDRGSADIWVGHRGMDSPELGYDIPADWLSRFRGLPDVQRAEPYIITTSVMQLPSGDFTEVIVVGSDPAVMLGAPWAFAEGSVDDLRSPDAISVDTWDTTKLERPKLGDVLEIRGARAKIVARTNAILGFHTTPYVFCNLESARRYTGKSRDGCSYFLVQTRPGADVNAVCAQIRERVPHLDVYSAAEFSRRSQNYWVARTGLGMSFGVSTLLGLGVGLAMVAQSLYAFVLDHLTDYATLKAMGADDRQVYFVLITQALAIAVFGAVLGVTLSLTVCHAVSNPLLTIEVPWWLVALGVAFVILICLIAALLPLARIRRVDPIMVLQG